MSRYMHTAYAPLKEYVPGEQPQDGLYIKLNTNESPYPPSPKVAAALNAAEIDRLNLYPDVTGGRLADKLAERCGVSKDNIFIVNGSDDALSFSFMAFGRSGVAFPDISYGFYKVYAQLYGCDAKVVPVRADLSVCAEDYLSLGRMIVIANPNAPTGLSLALPEIEKIILSNPDNIVLIDEAYVDFGGESCIPLIEKYDNLIVVQTFSKYRSLAGARLGFAVADKAIIADLNKLKFSTNPYNINRLTLLAGAAALSDERYYADNRDEIVRTREYVKKELQAMSFTCTDSHTNFLFAESASVQGGELYRKLKAGKILVRHFDEPRIDNYLRITIGTMEQMNTLLAKLREILDE